MNGTAPFQLRVVEVFRSLESAPEGLSPEEAQARLELYGRNALADPATVPLVEKLWPHFTHWLARALYVATVVAFVIGEPLIGFTVLSVVIANGFFSYWQEHRAEEAISALRKMLPSFARVVRGGVEQIMPAEMVVPGDVLVLAEGDNIPGDARVVEEYGLRINTAALNGETTPARKTADASFRDDLTELEQSNLVFAGTSVVSGTGRAVVYASGMLTQFGRIARLTADVKEEEGPLQKEMQVLTRKISYIAIGLSAFIFGLNVNDVGLDWRLSFLFSLGLLVAIIPEGLVPIVTLSLAGAVQRLSVAGVLVKKLSVIETLGAASVLCTDKSGTLTQNQMTVREIWVGGRRLSVTGVGYEPVGEFTPAEDLACVRVELEALLSAASSCNNSRLNAPTPERPRWTHLGDQTEAALRTIARKGGLDEDALAARYVRVHELPFDARRRRMATIHRGSGAGEMAFVKGGPREVVQLCTHILLEGQVCPLDAAMRREILAANDAYARNALRVLAFARRELPPRQGSYTVERIERELTFLGLTAMMDPPRPEVEAAVKQLHDASLRTVIITGDYGLTAESFARRVGLIPPGAASPRIITGADLDELDDAALQTALNEEVIFARVAPEHKMRVVAAFQARGEVVAVTGDGVNDAPALRKADIGIVMGVTGTDVAREAADVILTGDDFGGIVKAIHEGRAVYHNIRKFATYIFASNVPEIVPFFMAAIFQVPLALTVMQILAIDLGSDVLPALALGNERPEPGIMLEPPRRRAQPVFDQGLFLRAFLWLGLIEAALCYTGFFLVYHWAGALDQWWHWWDAAALPRADLWSTAAQLGTPDGRTYLMATTMFHAGVVAAQIGNAYACRTERERLGHIGWFSNRFLLVGIVVEVLVIAALIYVPPLAIWFNHVFLPLWPYAAILLIYPPALMMMEWLRKWLARLRRRSSRAQGALP